MNKKLEVIIYLHTFVTTKTKDIIMKIIKFVKEGCAPCIALSKWLKEKGISEEVEEVNPFEDFEKGIEFNIKTVPVLILLDDKGNELKRCIGDVNKNPKRYEVLIEMYNGKRHEVFVETFKKDN